MLIEKMRKNNTNYTENVLHRIMQKFHMNSACTTPFAELTGILIWNGNYHDVFLTLLRSNLLLQHSC